MALASNTLEPLVLADGRKVDPATGKVIAEKALKYIEVPSNTEAQQLVVRARKSVADLPLPPKQMSAVGIVAFYTLFGLSDEEIAVATNTSLPQVQRIKEVDAFREFMQEVRRSVLEQEQTTVREMFAQHAMSAAQTVIDLATNEGGVLGFKAAQDVLDRAGHRPADVVEHTHKMENALQIVVIEKKPESNIPIIEADYETLSG